MSKQMLKLMLAAIFLLSAAGCSNASSCRPGVHHYYTTDGHKVECKGNPTVKKPAQIATFFAPTVQRWRTAINTWAEEYGLDPNLVATVMQIESCGDPQALSSAGAAGLFQVMPFHFAAGEDPTDPVTNAARGLAYLKGGLDIANGDVGGALAGYNGGHSVINNEAAWADETRRYVRWGTGIYNDAVNGSATSQTLEDWLNAGGSNLCQRAAERLNLSQVQQ